MNEENVKVKVVLSHLRSLGISDQDLSFEDSFSLKIGTNKVSVGSSMGDSRTVRARSDVLIKKGPANLFVAEIKAPGYPLDDDDRDQAISYARLVHPIAPFAILTNGADWIVFDTVTRARLNPTDIKLKGGYQVALPDAARDEALSFFLGHSPENLMHFSRAQVAEQLKPLIGSPIDLSKKYIPELTIPRTTFLATLSAFEASERQGFLVLGESGDGKTSALCNYAQRRLNENKPTLFLSGLTLEGGLLNAISSEFGWVFSESVTPVQLIRRISDLCRGSPLTIIIDALDEWTYAQRGQALLGFLRGSRDLNVKVVFSCRFGAWEAISAPRGSDMGFQEYLFRAPSETAGRPYQLPALTDREFFRAVSRYRKVFQVRSMFEDKALDEAKTNPFMLRVMFVVAAEHGKDLTFSSAEFFARYWELTLRQTGSYDTASVQLLAAARLMYDKNSPEISDSELRESLKLPASDRVLPILFEQSILSRSGDGYRFYFQHLRNYLIAFKIKKWPEVSAEILKQVSSSGVQGDALALYLRYGSENQLRSFFAPRWQNAEEYLRLFRKIVADCFPKLGGELVYGNGSEIGFLAEYVVRDNAMGGFGFRRIDRNDRPVLFVPVDRIFSKSNLLALAGADSLHFRGNSSGFLSFDVAREVVESEVIPRIESVIKERRLCLRGRRKLAEESVVAAIHRGRDFFGEFIDSSYRRTINFPISTKAVRDLLVREKLYRHFEHELIESKLDNGSLQERYFKDGTSSYDPSLSAEEKVRIHDQVRTAMQEGKLPTSCVIFTNLRDLEEDFARSGALDDLQEIPKCPWSTEYGMSTDNLTSNYPVFAECWEVSKKLVTEHLSKFYQEFLDGYRAVVDTNFGPLNSVFPLRAKMPVRFYFHFAPRLGGRHEVEGNMMSTFEPLEKGMSNEVVACADGELTATPGGGIFYKGRFVSRAYSVGGVDKTMYWLGNCPLTEMIYSRIGQEWPHAAGELRKQYGVRSNRHTDPAGDGADVP